MNVSPEVDLVKKPAHHDQLAHYACRVCHPEAPFPSLCGARMLIGRVASPDALLCRVCTDLNETHECKGER